MSKQKPVCVNVVAMDKLIDYLMNGDGDWCKQCVYYTQPKKGEDYTSCNHETECKNGMLKYFAKGGTNDKASNL